MISPKKIKEQLKIKNYSKILSWRKEIKDIILKNSKKLLVIVWPCSIHNINEWLDYAKKLKELSVKYNNLFIVMRAYFEKPRSTIWWKWLIQDPDLDCSNNIEKWLFLARKFLLELEKIGLPAASELLEPLQVLYYEDLLSYWAIWARTTESQVHRELASWCDFPIWFKNSTDGDFTNALNSILSASKNHSFLSVNEEWKIYIKNTAWNKFWHIILRWWKNGPNYDENTINNVLEKTDKWIIVDVSHANSWKKAENQLKVVKDILAKIKNRKIAGLMIESNINFWNQSFNPCKDNKQNLKYGVSITDECVSLDQTDEILKILNENLW